MKDLPQTLEAMRFDIEGILIDAATAFKDAIPSCPSQTFRALRTIEAIDALPLEQRGAWLHRRFQLEDFCAISKAARILKRETLWNET